MSLDEVDRQVVLELIGETRGAGAVLIGTFRDCVTHEMMASHYLDMNRGLSCQEQTHVV